MPSRWQNSEDPTDTGVPVDDEYCGAHKNERTVSVGYDAQASVQRQPLATDGGDGSATGADAFIDEHSQQHTTAGETSSIVGSTFYADDARNTPKYERLWLFHSGKDVHKRGKGVDINPRHKEDTAARFNHERAEILCDSVSLSFRQKRAVLDAVDSTNFSRFTYLCGKADNGVGAVEVVTVGIVACVVAYWTDAPLEHPAVEEAAATVGVSDVEYVAREVAEKKAFSWVEIENLLN